MKLCSRVKSLKEERFKEIVGVLCADSLLVVLFGSRARGEDYPLSDFDLLVVRKEYTGDRLVINWPAQIFSYSLAEVRAELAGFNPVVLDALTEGKLVCGDEKLYEQLRREAVEMLEKKRLRKTGLGWVVS
ncbi:MAG: nucleotidyltransferase domain-containing protein [Candidatus Caldarchaeum sp.]|nr:nucleotidyltransferase domain-containing protein [Candidatus Caldarchaeum sp.]